MIDVLLDWIAYGIRYGWLSLTTLFLVLVALVRNRKLRKRFNCYLPPLFRDDENEVSQYIANQARIESKIDLIMERLGVPWNANTSHSLERNIQTNSYRFSILSRMGRSIVPSVTKFMNGRKENMKSRKFWIAVVSAVLLVVKEGLGIEVDAEIVLAFAGIVMGWIFAESHVDGKRAVNEKPWDQSENQSH